MNKYEERQVFDMAKQDIPFLKDLELVKHDDRPDFILKDKNGRLIGLEHFRADVYQVQDKDSSHISGGHTILDKSKKEVFQRYHSFSTHNTWNDKLLENASNDLCVIAKNTLDMQSNYVYEDFLDNLRVGIHGRPSGVKGHIQKSQNYPDRKNYDLMGFLIEVPVPSFRYYFETANSQQVSQIKSLLRRYPFAIDILNSQKIQRRYNNGYSYQRITGLPITNEIWEELSVFKDIDFIIIETHNSKNAPNNLAEHYGQYFDKDTLKPNVYPAFSFVFTDIVSTDVQTEYKESKCDALLNIRVNRPIYDAGITKTMWKKERQKQNRQTRKQFDKTTKKLCGK
jgi:hypothetical protein